MEGRLACARVPVAGELWHEVATNRGSGGEDLRCRVNSRKEVSYAFWHLR